MKRIIIAGFVVFLFLAGCQRKTEEQKFLKFVNNYFNRYFTFEPTWGTEAGLHQYDTLLPSYTKAGIDSQVAFLEEELKELKSISKEKLEFQSQLDYEILEYRIKGGLHHLLNIRDWERRPERYNPSGAILVLMTRNFAPQEERMKSAIFRMRKIPQALLEGRNNLKNPPRIFTEISIGSYGGSIEFFKNDVPKAFSDVSDSSLWKEFNEVNEEVIKSYEKFIVFLKDTLLPVSNGDFAIGEENYKKSLLYDEMIETPIDSLLSFGMRELRKTQGEFVETAKRINPKKKPNEILSEMEKEHPEAESLIPFVAGMLEDIRKFCIDKKIITIPSDVRPNVSPAPSFERETAFASMDTPGAFEKIATEAYYYVVPPEPLWDAKKKEQLMRFYNKYSLLNISVHETYPGHYVQFMRLKECPSKVRKLGWSGTYGEGWAHYCEQMMLDEGFGNNNLKLRLAQLQWALIRLCRYVVGIKLHCKGMSLEEAKKFFQEEAYMAPLNAEREAKRGTGDPTYLVYSLGKLEIMKLREDYKKMKRDSFSLLEFHDAIVKNGAVPIPILRRIMLEGK